MKKLLIASSVVWLASTGILAQASDKATTDRYNKSCIACHASGAAGAPVTGNAKHWAPRMEKGMDTLVASVDKGMNAMPPKGMCYDCSAGDFKALIEHMATPK